MNSQVDIGLYAIPSTFTPNSKKKIKNIRTIKLSKIADVIIESLILVSCLYPFVFIFAILETIVPEE
jgi:hypothetical protein